jgi:hypothetical protein
MPLMLSVAGTKPGKDTGAGSTEPAKSGGGGFAAAGAGAGSANIEIRYWRD